jgi:hypothetical protein
MKPSGHFISLISIHAILMAYAAHFSSRLKTAKGSAYDNRTLACSFGWWLMAGADLF